MLTALNLNVSFLSIVIMRLSHGTPICEDLTQSLVH